MWFWRRRLRPVGLWCSGGGFAVIGKDCVACAAARKPGTCSQQRSFRCADREQAVLELLRTRLMEPDPVSEFIRAFGAENTERAYREVGRATLKRKFDGLDDAIAEGLRTLALKENWSWSR
jgi:site-specific DNA recombinase